MWISLICHDKTTFRFHTEVNNTDAAMKQFQRYMEDGYRVMMMTGFRTKEAAINWAKGIGMEKNS